MSGVRLAGAPERPPGRLTLTWLGEPPADGGRRVVATGVFDLLHIGHTRFLATARAAGDSLVVGVEDDDRVRARKGRARPVLPARERAELLSALEAVDAAFLIGGPPDLWTPAAYAELLEPVRPRLLALTSGDPAEPGKREAAERLGAELVVVPLVAGWSTSILLTRGGFALGA